MLEVVHQDDALTVLFEFDHHRLSHLFWTAHLEIEGIEVGPEDGDVARGEIGYCVRRMPQPWEADGRRDRLPQCRAHGANAFLDLVLDRVFDLLNLAVDQTAAAGLG